MAHPTQAGQKVRTNFSKEILTVKNFFGFSEKPYKTYKEAIESNPKGGVIFCKNVEYGGYMLVRDCEMTAQQIADLIIEEVQPTQPTALDVLQGTVERHTFTAKTAKLSLEEAIYRRCRDNPALCNEVYRIIQEQF